METTKRESYPFGPSANVKTMLEHWRDRSMPPQITGDWMIKIGLSSNLVGKNLAALKFLGLIDADGNTTDVADRVRNVSAEEYKAVLEEIIRKAYAPVLSIRNPSVDARNRVEDAFRKAEPSAQRPRMVAFFLGMCTLAGIAVKDAPQPRASDRSRVGAPRRVKPESGFDQSEEAQAVKPALVVDSSKPSTPDQRRLHPAVQAWVDEIPAAGSSWDRIDFESWLNIFRASIERVYQIK